MSKKFIIAAVLGTLVVVLVVIFATRDTQDMPGIMIGNEGVMVTPGEYVLDTEKSQFMYASKRIIGGGHTGAVGIDQGMLVFNKDGAITDGELVLDMNEITEDQDNERFLGHLNSEDFFDVAQYGTSTFTIDTVRALDESGTYELLGDLTLKGQTHEEAIEAHVLGLPDETVVVQSNFQIDRTKWGITYDSASVLAGLGDKAIDDMIDLQAILIFLKRQDGDA